MKFGILGALGIASMALVSSAASAVTVTTFTPGNPEFTVSGDIWSGPISATLGRSGIAAGEYIDRYEFTIPQIGWGTGSITTSSNAVGLPGDIAIDYVMVNGVLATDFLGQGRSEAWGITNVPVDFGVLNTIEIKYTSFGDGSYGGNASFNPIPEPATWAMMIAGFGLIGVAMRKRQTVKATAA